MRGGFGVLTDALAKSARQRGGRLLAGHTAMNISREQSGQGRPLYRVSCILDNCSTVEIMADAVIATLSSRQFASITTSLNLPEEYVRKVRLLRYKGDLCLIDRRRSAGR